MWIWGCRVLTKQNMTTEGTPEYESIFTNNTVKMVAVAKIIFYNLKTREKYIWKETMKCGPSDLGTLGLFLPVINPQGKFSSKYYVYSVHIFQGFLLLVSLLQSADPGCDRKTGIPEKRTRSQWLECYIIATNAPRILLHPVN